MLRETSKKVIYGIILMIFIGVFSLRAFLGGPYNNSSSKLIRTSNIQSNEAITVLRDRNVTDNRRIIISKYEAKRPKHWGEKLSGVVIGLDTKQKIVALTFDACGGSPRGNGYDAQLIDFLIKHKISATLFISGRWIDANPKIFQALAKNKLFDIENHGLNHKPASVNGRSAYGIQGCSNVSEFLKELDENGKKIKLLTGRNPVFYRSGTNYYDEVAVDVAGESGYKIVSYSVLGDAGATFNKQQVKQALITAPAGSIIILHMNHPEGKTAEGVMAAIPIMQKNGFKFVKINNSSLKLAP